MGKRIHEVLEKAYVDFYTQVDSVLLPKIHGGVQKIGSAAEKLGFPLHFPTAFLGDIKKASAFEPFSIAAGQTYQVTFFRRLAG